MCYSSVPYDDTDPLKQLQYALWRKFIKYFDFIEVFLFAYSKPDLKVEALIEEKYISRTRDLESGIWKVA